MTSSDKLEKPASTSRPTYQFEAEWADDGPVIGIDEAGRGPWAGPVTAAAFWICPEHRDTLPAKLTDSKKLTASQRADIEAELCNPANGHLFAIHHSPVDEIDRLGILPATFKAMQAVAIRLSEQLLNAGHATAPSFLVDGNLLPELPFRARAIIKGDSLSLSIAAASIIAKQSRDRLMTDLAAEYPEYGWHTNAGYGTQTHQQALRRYGVTDHHRRSYAPIRRYLQTGTL